MLRRQFLKAIAAVAAVIVAPFKTRDKTLEWWNRNTGEIQLVVQSPSMIEMDFSEIEARVMTYLKNEEMVQDGLWHHYAYNSRGEIFVDGKSV